MERYGSSVSNRLGHLVQTTVGSLPVQDPHLEQRQEGRIIDLCLIHLSKPFSPLDHMGPESIIKEEVQKRVSPPSIVGSFHVLPSLYNAMKGILGDL